MLKMIVVVRRVSKIYTMRARTTSKGCPIIIEVGMRSLAYIMFTIGFLCSLIVQIADTLCYEAHYCHTSHIEDGLPQQIKR